MKGQPKPGPKAKTKATTRSQIKASTENRVFESAGVISSTDAVTDPGNAQQIIEGPKMKVWLLTEGLGNLRDKNYYGPECIRAGPPIFEGSKMLLNHPGEEDERNRPEGDVEKTVAYYRNCRAETVQTPEGPKLALTAEAHFDQTQEGLNAFAKAKTAVHFRDDFPASDKEYVAISVNAVGESEPRNILVNGQPMDVNYVMRFAEGSRGADMVTFAARGGSFRALIEDIYGARPTKEAEMKKLIEALELAQTQIKEAMDEKDATKRQKKTLEAQTALTKAVRALKEGAKNAKLDTAGEAGGATTITSGEEADDSEPVQHDPENPDCECEACKPSEADPAAAPAGDPDPDAEPSSHVVTHKAVTKGKAAIAAAAKQEADRKEMQKIAVERLIEATGIKAKYFDVAALSVMPFREAKMRIEMQKKMHEAAVETVISRIGPTVSASHRARESAVANGEQGDEAFNQSLLPALTQ